ncbi:MAG TPA: hypothetical protein VGL82_05185 [Bryobacteraceae bacterium]|jgi:HEAT repeat protein
MVAVVSKICDPGLYTLAESIQLAQISAQTMPGFEVDLVRFLQSECQVGQTSLPSIYRGLEVLGGMLSGGTANENRLIALLRPFLRSSNPQIASKCILVLGRHSSSMAWLNNLMAEPDERIRANLIESLWKRKEPEVERILRNALRDRHARVAANAVYGLYLLEIDAWEGGVNNLLTNKDAAFRKSGIWVLRSIGAADAPPRIKLLIRDTDPGVRRAAFSALAWLRKKGSKETPEITVGQGFGPAAAPPAGAEPELTVP